MKKFLLSSVVAAAALCAPPAGAEEIRLTAEDGSNSPITGVKLCLASNTKGVSLMAQSSFVETAIVIKNTSGKYIVKANNHFEGAAPANYWTSKLPRSVDLDAGCYIMYLMVKRTPPSTSSKWYCAWPQITTNLTTAAGSTVTSIGGGAGSGYLSHIVMIPGAPDPSPKGLTTCDAGY